CEERPVRCTVDDHGLDLFAHHAAAFVNFVKCIEQDVAQRSFADCHRAAERVQDADFDGVFRVENRRGIECECGQSDRAETANEFFHECCCGNCAAEGGDLVEFLSFKKHPVPGSSKQTTSEEPGR